MEFKILSIPDLKTMLQDNPPALVDIRDPQSYEQAHIENAFSLDNNNVEDFIREADMDKPLVVYCYHGMSSQSAAAFFVEKGFSEVYSLEGGFEGWRTS